MFFELNQLFSTKLPHRFECGLVNALDPDGSGRGEGGRSDGASGGNGSGGASGSGGLSGGGGGGLGGERSASGRTGINGSINGTLGDSAHTRSQHPGDYDGRGNYTGGIGGVGSHGGDPGSTRAGRVHGYSGGLGSNSLSNGMSLGGFNLSAGMNPDARDDPSRKGIDGMGQGLSGTSRGQSRSFGDSLGLAGAQFSADPLGYSSHLAKENAFGLVGGAIGLATTGVPGMFAGNKIGSIVDDYGKLSKADIASGVLGGLSAFGTPGFKMATSIASTAIDPDTKASSHIAGVVGAGLGGKLAGKYGAGAMADLGQTLGNLAPAGEMNPRNSDLSSADSVSTGIGTSMGGDGSSAIPSMALNSNLSKVSNMQSLQNAKQWDDYQSRYHNG